MNNLDPCLSFYIFFFLQIYTDFDEIRQEIENETERISGNNKVRHGWRMEMISDISQLLIKHLKKGEVRLLKSNRQKDM